MKPGTESAKLLNTSEILDRREMGWTAKSLGEHFASNHIPSILVKLRLWVQSFKIFFSSIFNTLFHLGALTIHYARDPD